MECDLAFIPDRELDREVVLDNLFRKTNYAVVLIYVSRLDADQVSSGADSRARELNLSANWTPPAQNETTTITTKHDLKKANKQTNKPGDKGKS